MFIKKVGYLLLIRLRLFKLLAKLSPILMLASIVFTFFLVHLKEEYKFQEPSLKTKIFDVASQGFSQNIRYLEVFQGIKTAQIKGVLDNECILITFPSTCEQSLQIRNIYQSISAQKHLSKNLVLLSYENPIRMQKFFQWYFQSSRNPHLSFGVIRVGLNVQVVETNEDKDKAFLKIYSSTLHPDVDYFQAAKELLQKMALPWSPCEQLHRSATLKNIRQGLVFIQESLRIQTSMKLFFDHVLCQLSQHISYQLSAHEIMMKQGFQAATLRFLVGSRSQKVEKFVVSFVNEFGMQEDHLHSAGTVYYPFSKTYFAPLMLFLSPSLLFFTALAIYLLNLYTDRLYRQQVILDREALVMTYTMDYVFSICLASALLGFSIIRDFVTIIRGDRNQNMLKTSEMILIALSGLISIYFGVFCCALSHLVIILTIMMVLKPRNLILRQACRLSLAIVFATTCNLQDLPSEFMTWSPQLKLCAMIPLIYYSLCAFGFIII